jgi:uncharacterized damage-inducible protein DinB
MSDRAQQLADQLQQANEDVIAFVEAASPETWGKWCPGEQCTVAALASHIGDGCGGILDSLVLPVAEGRPGPVFTPDDLHRGNAAAAQANATRPKAEVLAVLREQGQRAVSRVRELTDEQLQRTEQLPFSPEPISAEAVIEHVLIGHPRGHLASLQTAVDQTAHP